jgi:hypothetical protein
MKPIYFKAILLSVLSCCAGCTTLHLLLPGYVVSLDSEKPATWLVGEWQSSGAKHNPSKQPCEVADWVVTGGVDKLLVFTHDGSRYEVLATSYADDPNAALLEVTQVQGDGKRWRDSTLYVARLNDEILSIKPLGSDALMLAENVKDGNRP